MRRLVGTPLARAVLVVAVVAGAWALHLARHPLPSLGDIAVYARTYRLIEQGALPYRDFALEYPPLGAALFWVAGALPGAYPETFGLLVLACLAIAVAGALDTARTLRLGPVHRAALVALAALTPFLLGTDLVVARYDPALAAVLAWVAATAARGRWPACWVLVAVGILLKLTPLLLVPALLVMQAGGRRRPSLPATVRATVRAGWRGWGVASAVLAAGLAPALAASTAGTLRMLQYHLERPLQIEAVPGTAVLVDHALRGTGVVQVRSYGSDNLDGAVAGALQQAGSVLAVAGVLAVAALLARRLWRDPETVPETVAEAGVLALAATLAVAIVTGKVLSPQYLLWLVPLVPLIRGWRGPAGAVALGVAMVLSREVFPARYVALVEDLATTPIALLATRNLLLVATAALLVHALAGGLGRPPRPAPERAPVSPPPRDRRFVDNHDSEIVD
ncbi:MAG: hypothetical protein ACFCVG_18110 [Kineosporiaceae bacterium]